jgi:hypothetical protein
MFAGIDREAAETAFVFHDCPVCPMVDPFS